MSKLKLVAGIIIFGLHGFHCITMAQTLESQKNQIKNSTTKIQSAIKSINKFEFQSLPYSYDALDGHSLFLEETHKFNAELIKFAKK